MRSGDESGLRQRRTASVGGSDTYYDVKEKVMVGFGYFQTLMLMGIASLVLFAGAGFVMEQGDLVMHGPTLKQLKPKYSGGRLPLYEQEDAVALVVMNSTLPSHRTFLQDARKANAKHNVTLASVFCDKHEDACEHSSLVTHGKENLVPKYELNGEEPVILFLQAGRATESFHDAVKNGTVKMAAGRAGRVQALVDWLDVAAERAKERSEEAFKHDEDIYGDGMGGMGGMGPHGMGGMGGYPGMGGMGGMGGYPGMGEMGGMEDMMKAANME